MEHQFRRNAELFKSTWNEGWHNINEAKVETERGAAANKESESLDYFSPGKTFAHSSSIGSDFKKCIQIMKESYPSYKSVLMHENRELNKMKRTSRNSGISSNTTTTTKRKQNDIVTTALDNEPPPLQHNRVSLESGALENTQLDESPSVVPDNRVPALLAAPQHNRVSLLESASVPAFFTIPPMINVENTINSFFAGPTLITPTTSSASCAPSLPTTASSSSVFYSTNDTIMMDKSAVAISSSSSFKGIGINTNCRLIEL